jgi:hypothetical protein
MPWFRLRPTFEIQIEETRPTAIEKLRLEHARSSEGERFLLQGEYGELHLPPAEHRLWSPHLSFYVFERDGCCRVHGRFAPRVDVWTSVWIAYLALAFTAFFGLAMAVSQWLLQQSIWGLWVAIASLLVLFGVYLLAHVGQQLSVDQMQNLRRQLESILTRAGISMPNNANKGVGA